MHFIPEDKPAPSKIIEWLYYGGPSYLVNLEMVTGVAGKGLKRFGAGKEGGDGHSLRKGEVHRMKVRESKGCGKASLNGVFGFRKQSLLMEMWQLS